MTVDIDARHEVSDAATAVRLAAETMPVDQTFMLFDGRDPTVFETSPDNPIRFDANSGTVRVSSSTGSPGVKALIGPGLATRLAGQDVRVTIVARSSSEAGAAGHALRLSERGGHQPLADRQSRRGLSGGGADLAGAGTADRPQRRYIW